MSLPYLTPPPPSQGSEEHDRAAVLRALGLDGPDAHLDDFAQGLAQDAGVPYAMINIFAGGRQQFYGLCTPGDESSLPTVGRSMSVGDGFCPEVVRRATPLVLPDVYAAPRFAGNAVVDQIGIRTYAGAPLIHESGIVLGTVCFVGPQEKHQTTGQASLVLIKQRRDEVLSHLYRRVGHHAQQ